ncbi:adenylyl-sulfate kinase [Pelagibaculum spongiae]|uniref:Adenylyl-sulfate kinase n=1 Tax=Pelagibaculum spongiae TaxID=2080658 RepID=A0A2V1GQ89_9GAMM|nr:adenylyl-sulfate kinase [Pelagibaculum spongiae]PVZ63516.1 adenylyl-sulfate kinase [Pelagibaculum spongiae]
MRLLHPKRTYCIWFTGLPGAGKSRLAHLVERYLKSEWLPCFLLDEHNLRQGLSSDLTHQQYSEATRRISETSRLMNQSGMITLVSDFSPYAEDRRRARQIHPPGQFFEVFVDTPAEVCQQRAKQGKFWMGDGRNYQPPENPEVAVLTGKWSEQESLDYLLKKLPIRDAKAVSV